MKLVVQRVTDAKVIVDEKVVGEIGKGLLVLAGFGRKDSLDLADSPVWSKLVDKLLNLRIFSDAEGRMNLSLKDIEGDIMLVSQFTLFADCKRGRRPSFTDACEPNTADILFDHLVDDVRKNAPANVATGVFGAEMFLDFTNWGPVTIILDSEDM